MVINHEPNIPGTYQAKSDKLLVADAGVEPRYCTAYETGVIYISVSLSRNIEDLFGFNQGLNLQNHGPFSRNNF